MKQQIVFLDRGTVPPHVVFPSLGKDYEWIEYDYTSADLVVERLQKAAICIVNKIHLTADILQHLPNLKLIALTATGSDNIDLKYCQKRGIGVSNVVAYGTPSIVEHVFSMVLALKRNLSSYREAAFSKWSEGPFFTGLHYPVHELNGSVLGVIGKGTLGTAAGKLGEAFGMKVLYAERKGAETLRWGYADFIETLKKADVLTIHIPLTESTKDLIGEEELSLMKPTAILINTARGGIVNEEALVTAIKNQSLGGAGIDVTKPEPPLPDNPLLALKSFPNVILTPHIAWGGENALKELSAQVMENIQSFSAGKRTRRLV